MSFSSKVKEELVAISRKDFTLKRKTSKMTNKDSKDISEGEKRSIIREAFLQSGSISDPEKCYHFEIVYLDEAQAIQMKQLLASYRLDGKIVQRKGHFVVYLKEGAQIGDMLRIMEAHQALMEFENIRILKEMRNSINRQVNCEAANLGKTISAAVKQVEDIKFICKKTGLENLPAGLAEVAEKRLKYPEATLKELGELMEPPLGKSGVNHRLKKLSDLAEDLRSHEEGQNYD